MRKVTQFIAALGVSAIMTTPLQAENGDQVQDHASPEILESLTLTPDNNQYIIKKDANVRIGPNTAFDVAGVVHSGDIIQSIGRARAWVAFEMGSQTVFIWEDLLNKWKAWPTSTVDTLR